MSLAPPLMKGEVVYRRGDEDCSHIFGVLQGTVDVYPGVMGAMASPDSIHTGQQISHVSYAREEPSTVVPPTLGVASVGGGGGGGGASAASAAAAAAAAAARQKSEMNGIKVAEEPDAGVAVVHKEYGERLSKLSTGDAFGEEGGLNFTTGEETGPNDGGGGSAAQSHKTGGIFRAVSTTLQGFLHHSDSSRNAPRGAATAETTASVSEVADMADSEPQCRQETVVAGTDDLVLVVLPKDVYREGAQRQDIHDSVCFSRRRILDVACRRGPDMMKAMAKLHRSSTGYGVNRATTFLLGMYHHDSARLFSWIRQFAFMQQFPPSQVKRLVSVMEFLQFRGGDVVCSLRDTIGDDPAFYMVVSGSIIVRSRDASTSMLRQGDTVSHMYVKKIYKQ